MPFKIVIALIIATLFGWVASTIYTDWKIPEHQRIYFPGTKSYTEAIKKMKIGEAEALELLRNSVKDKPLYVDKSPLFFVNNEYCFGTPRKYDASLTGYYVHATSGRIIFRQSNENITRSDEKIPPDAYVSETIIRQ